MKQIITSTIYRMINKKLKEFSAKLVENHIEVQGPNQVLEVFVFIRNGDVVIEIDNEYHKHIIGYEMDIDLQELVIYVLSDIDYMDRSIEFVASEYEGFFKD